MKLNKLFAIVMAAAVVLGCAGCKNDLTLAEKLIDKGGAPVPSVTYNIDWNTNAIEALSKTPYELATEASKIVFGYDKDYSEIKTNTSYTKYAIGETDDDAVYAYYKASAPSELYVLSEGEIKFEEDDIITYDIGEGNYYYLGPFALCSEAESIILKNINTTALTHFSYCFVSCEKLTEINLSGLDTENATTMEMMFGNCEKIDSIDVSNFITNNVIDMENMFSGCIKLKSIDISNFNMSNVENMEGMFRSADDNALESINFGNIDTSKVKNMTALFESCANLKNIDLSKFNTSNVTNMKGMFAGCKSLESLNVTNFDTKKVTDMEMMFRNCEKLQTLNVSNFVTTKVTDMKSVFSGCKSLKTLDLSNFDTSEVTEMSGMFFWCNALESVDLSSFDTSKVTLMNMMFYSCPSLTELDLSNFSFSNTTTLGQMFYGASQLKTIYVKDGTDLSSIPGDAMFYNCTSLVGGKGTVYDSSKTDKTYARIDGGSAAPGYFTKKGDSSGDSGESAVLYELDLFGKSGYFGYNKTTCKITNVWVNPDFTDLEYTLYIPSSSYHDQLLEIDGSKDGHNRDGWGRDTPKGKLLLQIAEDSSTASYRLDFIEVSTSLQEYGYEYFADIAAAFPDKASPVLPAANTGHDVFYIKDFCDNRYIYDLTNNTVSTIDSSVVSSTNNQIVITGDPITLNTKPKTEFPDMTTAERVSNPCSHQIVIYDDTNETLQIGKVPEVPSNKEGDCCAPLYKTPDNKYYQRVGL